MNYFKILFLLGYTLAFGQVGIGTDNLNPNAILELQSANQGLLLPRISDMDQITDDVPAGLLVYDKSKNCISVYNGADWEFLEEVAISTTGTSSTTATTNYVGVGIGTEDPNPDAILELQSNNKGLLLPRIDNLNQITGSVPEGLLVYDKSKNYICFYNGTGWKSIVIKSLVEIPDDDLEGI